MFLAHLFPQFSTMPDKNNAPNAGRPGLSGGLKKYSRVPYPTRKAFNKAIFAYPGGINASDTQTLSANWQIAFTRNGGFLRSATSDSHKIYTPSNVATVNKTAATFVSFISTYACYSWNPTGALTSTIILISLANSNQVWTFYFCVW